MELNLRAVAHLFNGAALVVWLGCNKEPAAVVVADAATDGRAASPDDPKKAKKKKKDATTAPPVPVAPLDLMVRLPDPPPPIAARPGDPIKGMAGRKKLKASPLTDAILVQAPDPKSAFDSIHYQLDASRKQVRAVLATFKPVYGARDRWDALEEAMKVRLGEGDPLVSASHTGRVWQALAYRIELRRDRVTKDIELLLHGRSTDNAPPE